VIESQKEIEKQKSLDLKQYKEKYLKIEKTRIKFSKLDLAEE
jgi:hypothetical protein